LNYIVGLNAFSGKDVWATGSYYQGANQYTLAEHWNGLVWELVPSPNAGVNGNNAFNGMASSGPNDIWAVGDYNDSAHSNQTLIEHWDGHAWTIVLSPNQPGFNALYPTAAFSPTDAWVAGYYIAPGSANQTPLLLHWDGQTWRIVANPPTPPDATKVRFNGMGGRNGKDIWMVGSYRSNGSYHSLTEHWNGDAWTYQAPTLAVADEEISPASDPSAYSELYSVAVGPHGEVWAAGAWSTHLRPEDEVANPELLHTPGIRTLLLRWNGQTWRRVTSETPGQAGEFLALAPHAALPWAVGTYLNQEPAQTLIEQAHRR